MPFLLELLTLKLSKEETAALDEARKGTRLSREALIKKVMRQMLGERTIEIVKSRNAEADQDALLDEIDEALEAVRGKRE